MNFTLKDHNDLIKFLFDIKMFEDWEVVRVQISSNLGANLIMNTKVNDPSGLYDYQLLKRVKSIIQSFMNENYHLTLNIDIKLRMPKKEKMLMDTKQEYKDFFLDFYSAGGTLTMLTASQLEKNLTSSPEVISLWRNYIQQLVEKWKNSNGYESI